MGIPHYFKIVVDECPDVIRSCSDGCDRLFLDFNCAIHNCKSEVATIYEGVSVVDPVEFEEKLCAATCAYLDKIVTACAPREMLFVAVDGVAPIAKMVQQRRRRFMSVWEKKARATQQLPTECPWDSNAITPGTEFMDKLMSRLRDHIGVPERYGTGVKAILSSHRTPGEGEHKIFAFIQTNVSDGKRDVVYGLDADLMMLAMLNTRSGGHEIRLMRESKQLVAHHAAAFAMVDMVLFAERLRQRVRDVYGWAAAGVPVGDEIKTYVALCFLVGNDFIPALSYLRLRTNAIDFLMIGYATVRKEVGKDLLIRRESDGLIRVDHDVMLAVIGKVANGEAGGMRLLDEAYQNSSPPQQRHRRNHNQNQNQNQRSHGPGQGQGQLDVVLHYPKLRENKVGGEICPGTRGWVQRYYHQAFRSVDQSYLDFACKNYIDGYLWCVDYYYNHRYDGGYYYKYNYSPLADDIYKVMLVTKFFIEDRKSSEHYVQYLHKAVSSTDAELLLQLLMVLPQQSHDLMGKNIKNTIMLPSQGIAQYYPTTFKLVTYLKTFGWECIPDIPPVSRTKLQRYITTATQTVV